MKDLQNKINNENLSANKIESKSTKNKQQKDQTNENADHTVAGNKKDEDAITKDIDEIVRKNKEEKDSINLEEEITRLRNEKLRLLAEMENLRKRSEKEKVESIKFGSSNLVRDFLSPNDNLTRALENVPKEKESLGPIKNLIKGLKMVQKEFATILERHGVKKIDALNKKFDHNFHQAMLEIEIKDKEEGIVVQEIQSGYTMHDRLLRPTLVGVSKKPQQDKKKE